MHFLYILICLNIAMFLGYTLDAIFGVYEALKSHMPWIVAKMINAIILGFMTYIIKLVVWFVLLVKKRQNTKLKEEYKKLQAELDHLKKQNKNKNQE